MLWLLTSLISILIGVPFQRLNDFIVQPLTQFGHQMALNVPPHINSVNFDLFFINVQKLIFFLIWKMCLSLSIMSYCATYMSYSLQGSSIHGILQARILEWIPFSRGSSRPRDWTWVSCIAGRFFTTEPLGKPLLLSEAKGLDKDTEMSNVNDWNFTPIGRYSDEALWPGFWEV